MSYKANAMSIRQLIRDIDDYYLPAIQREFIWPPEKIEALFDSLLRGYPIGTMLLWDVGKDAIHEFQFYELIRDFDAQNPHNVKANLVDRSRCFGILDGQQRVTSLYIGLKGSRRDKLLRLWWNNPDAFPEKKLYINLLFEVTEENPDQLFEVRFLTEQQVQNKVGHLWFKVGDILLFETQAALLSHILNAEYRDNPAFQHNLVALWNAIHEPDRLSFFFETRQELDEVLAIFVRLNMGGTPLSYSDLLLSLATASWGEGHDAREEVYRLVEYLNKDCGSFNFSKDFVLKTLLVLNEADVRFRAANVRKNLHLEDIWERAELSLKIAVKLIHKFGFNWQTLSTHNAVIPIAYYIYKRNLGENFLTQKDHEEDREKIRIWLLKMLLGRVFRGQTDQLLTRIREIMRGILEGRNPATKFPADDILKDLSARGTFVFTPESIEAIIADTSYGTPFAFATLALLFPNMNYQYIHFHLDHMHPAANFTKQKLEATGMPQDDVSFALERRDRLANLQFLPDSENLAKQDRPLADWLGQHANPELMRTLNLIPNTDLSLGNFKAFYLAREQLLKDALKAKLGVTTSAAIAHDPLSSEALEIDEASDV
jgi:hypothetical protein